MRRYIATGLLCLSAGCGAKFESKKDTRSPIGDQPDFIRSAELQEFVEAKVQPAPKPERYVVYLSWPKFEDPKRLRIRTTQVLSEIEPSQMVFNHEVDHNQVIQYTFEILDDVGRVDSHFFKTVTVPRDFVVDSDHSSQTNFTANTKLQVNRVFFLEEDTPLRTNGFNVEIEADEIHSDNGLIETFAQDSKAQIDKAGRDGGSLSISANLGVGSLRVIMRGEAGGDGSKGAPTPGRGPKGSNPGYAPEYCSGDPTMGNCVCTDDAAPGGTGGQGAKGVQGNPAQPGGASGNFAIKILNSKEFKIDVQKNGGPPGIPGPGGDGQAGGEGGYIDSDDCQGPPGQDGPQGLAGDSGLTAATGNLGTVCIILASERRNECF